MRNQLWIGVLAGLLSVGAAAQTAKDAEKGLRENLVKKQMFLRGFSDDQAIHWKWSGTELVQDPPQFMALSAITIKSVKVNGEKVVIDGDRQVLVRAEGHNVQFTPPVGVTITVDLHGANVAEVLPTLPGLLFYNDLNDAVNRVPTAYAELIPTPPAKKSMGPASTCDCDHPAACQDNIPFVAMAGIKPPHGKIELPPVGPEAKYVTVVVQVDEKGHASEVWLGRPLGAQIDEQALTTVKTYNFTPATCHDKPVSAAMRIDVPIGGDASSGGRGRR